MVTNQSESLAHCSTCPGLGKPPNSCPQASRKSSTLPADPCLCLSRIYSNTIETAITGTAGTVLFHLPPCIDQHDPLGPDAHLLSQSSQLASRHSHNEGAMEASQHWNTALNILQPSTSFLSSWRCPFIVLAGRQGPRDCQLIDPCCF